MTHDTGATPSDEPIELAHLSDFALGAMTIRPSACEIEIEGAVHKLEPRVMQVLSALARSRDAVVSRDDLIRVCWNGVIVGDDAINRVIGRLRRLSELAPGRAFAIETIAKTGYRLRETAAALRDKRPGRLEAASGLLRKRPRMALVATLCLFLAAIAGALQLRARPAPELPRIVVLPFTVQEDDPRARHLADTTLLAIGEALTSAGIPVVSRSLSERYQGERRAEAYQALRADYIVDGEARFENGRVSVAVRLDEARLGVTLLSETFDAVDAEAGRLPDQIAASIARRVMWTWNLSRLDANRRTKPEVLREFYQVVLRQWREDQIGAYQRARGFAAAYPNDAIAQHAQSIQTGYAFATIPIEELPEAIAAARAADRRARVLAPDNGDSYIAASMLTPPHRWGERESHLRCGVTRDTHAPTTPSFLAQLLLDVGRTREAQAWYEAALARDPFNPNKNLGLLFALETQRVDPAAVNALRARIRRYWPGEAAALARRRFYAIRLDAPLEVERLLNDPEGGAAIEPPGGPTPIRRIARALVTRSQRDILAARRACDAEMSAPAEWYCVSGLAGLGETDQAFRLAETMFPEQRAATPEAEETLWLSRTAVMANTRVLFTPAMATLRADPRFIAVAERIGLLEYWRLAGLAPDFCAAEHAPICAQLAATSAQTTQGAQNASRELVVMSRAARVANACRNAR